MTIARRRYLAWLQSDAAAWAQHEWYWHTMLRAALTTYELVTP